MRKGFFHVSYFLRRFAIGGGVALGLFFVLGVACNPTIEAVALSSTAPLTGEHHILDMAPDSLSAPSLQYQDDGTHPPLTASLAVALAAHHSPRAGVSHPASQPIPTDTTADNLPFLHIFPSQDGTMITVRLESDTLLAGDLFANVGRGPTGFKRGWAMRYSTDDKWYSETLPFDLPEPIGRVNITSTSGLSTVDIRFRRAQLQPQTNAEIRSADDLLSLTMVNADALSQPTFFVITNNSGQPGALSPSDITLLSPSYSIRPPVGLSTANKPLLVTIHYGMLDLRGATPEMLDIYRWDEAAQRWQPQGAIGQPQDQALSLGTVLFGTYALAARPQWRAEFSDHELPSLDDKSMVERGLSASDEWVLNLRTVGTGSAISKPITPTFGLDRWESVSFTAYMDPPTATLSVDLLTVANEVVMRNVTNGQSLAALDGKTYPALRLRVNMTATDSTTLPALVDWQLHWQQPQPGRVQVGDGSVALGALITVPVALVMPPVTGLSGATFALHYDPDVLQPVACVLTVPAAAGFCNPAYATDTIRFNLLITSAITTEMPLAEVTMRAVGWVETGTRLAVSTVAAVDKLGEPVTLMGASGLITVTGQPNGDVNCDLQVDQHDVDLILQYDVGLAAMDQHCPPAAQMLFFPQCDVNGDGHCDLRDAQQLRR